MHFPMYTVALHTLLGMSKVETHEQLKAQDLLVEFRKNTGQAAFLSHEWLDIGHPDAECKQMRVLQDALKHMMGNLHSIPVDLVSEGFGEGVKPLPTSKLSGPLFFWYDYFSCPQMDDEWSRGVLLDAINSIPAYVDECSFFFCAGSGAGTSKPRADTVLMAPQGVVQVRENLQRTLQRALLDHG